MKQVIILLLVVAFTNATLGPVYQFNQDYLNRCSYLRSYKRDSQASLEGIDVTLGAGFNLLQESALCLDKVCQLFRKQALVLDLWHTNFLDGNSGCNEPLPFGSNAACHKVDGQEPNIWRRQEISSPQNFADLLNEKTVDTSQQFTDYQYAQLSAVKDLVVATWQQYDYEYSVYSIQFVTKELIINYGDICPNSLSARFILAIQNLKSKIGNGGIQPSDIQNLIEIFGTSVITQVTYGGRATLIRKGNFNEAQTEAVFRANQDNLIFQGGDAVAIHTTSEKYNTWKRTIQENPNIISVKFMSLGSALNNWIIFQEYGLTQENLFDIQSAYFSYMDDYTESIQDTTFYWGCANEDIAYDIGMKYCLSDYRNPG